MRLGRFNSSQASIVIHATLDEGIGVASSLPRSHQRASLKMAWTIPRFDNGRRNSAGKALAAGIETDEDLQVINNWRSSHSAPLQTIKMLLLRRARRVDPKAVIAQRLKRLSSIRAKLQREQSMRLPQMQDIGGCRAILKDMHAVDRLVEAFKKNLSKNPKSQGSRRHESREPKDYVARPKPDGYRSIHYVFKYHSNSKHFKVFNGQLVEIQIRTRLQHAWATAVETVDTFTGQSLKTSLKSRLGDEKWKRFFVLMGSAIALREKRSLVENSHASPAELKAELKSLATEIGVDSILSNLGLAVKTLGDKPGPDAAAYILELNSSAKNVTVFSFSKDQISEAQTHYLEMEKRYEDNPAIQVVQVLVEDIAALRVAFPNYYLDTTVFIEALRQAIR